MKQKITLFFDNDPDNFIDKYLCHSVKPIRIKESPLLSKTDFFLLAKKNTKNI